MAKVIVEIDLGDYTVEKMKADGSLTDKPGFFICDEACLTKDDLDDSFYVFKVREVEE